EDDEDEVGVGVEVALDVADGLAEAAIRQVAGGVGEDASGEIAGEVEGWFVAGPLEEAEGGDGDGGVVFLERGVESGGVVVPAARLVVALGVEEPVLVAEGDAGETV